ncbi:hypothetical protein ACFWSF_24405 [Streptomyces sp. NPDC058611]|uniref:hypothetical protein n=1 Tax=unclassified Streptomyces TaxID=2593676 RepID=UPI00365542FA
MTTPDLHGLRLAAALNNAAWCDAVCRSHGLPGTFAADAWTNPRRTPPLYPDAVTLTPDGVSAAALVAAVDTGSPGCSVKDSFAALDLGPEGFRVLFEAQWIHRPAGAPVTAAGPLQEWSEVAGAGELRQWEAAWAGGEPSGLFRPDLLAGGTVFLTGRAGSDGTAGAAGASTGGRIVAGAVAHRTGDVVGVSNLFARDGASAGAAWAGTLTAVASRWPGLPVVGYESGDDLDAALRAGFTALGPLRVWIAAA